MYHMDWILWRRDFYCPWGTQHTVHEARESALLSMRAGLLAAGVIGVPLGTDGVII